MRVSRTLALSIMGALLAISAVSCAPSTAHAVDYKVATYGDSSIDDACILDLRDSRGNPKFAFDLKKAYYVKYTLEDKNTVEILLRFPAQGQNHQFEVPVNIGRAMYGHIVQCIGKK